MSMTFELLGALGIAKILAHLGTRVTDRSDDPVELKPLQSAKWLPHGNLRIHRDDEGSGMIIDQLLWSMRWRTRCFDIDKIEASWVLFVVAIKLSLYSLC